MTSAITCKRDGLAKAHHIGRVVGMMVDDSARRKGMGRALLAASIAEARLAEGLSMLTLTVITSNAQDVGLYERAGLRRYGRLERAIRVDGAFHAKDLMALGF